MKLGSRSLRSLIAVSLMALMLVPATLSAGERQKRMKPKAFNPADETVEMFEAIEADQIEVKLIPKDSTQSRVLVKNKTDKPLNVKLPEAFAGMPVAAQFGGGGGGFGGGGFGGGGFGGGPGGGGGGGGFGGGPRGGGGGGGGSQSIGGGMGGMGGGMFNIPAEAVGDVKVATVCLEHGKKEPNARMTYEIRPIESFTDKEEVKVLCQMLGEGEIPQRSAQAAAWHLSNDMSWQDLASEKIERANGAVQSYFNPREVQLGMQIVNEVKNRIEKQSSQPTESLSER